MHESDKGGSLYLSCTKGECIQDRICSFSSNTVNEGAYCYISVSKTSPFKNYLLDSTITSSGDENPKENSNIDLENGEINMKSINISNSKLDHESFYFIFCNSNSNVTLSTFSNNTTTNETYCQAFHDGSIGQIKILFCNYYENEGKYFIFSSITLYINNCSFNKNNIKELYIHTLSQIQVKGCYFDISDPPIGLYVTITEKVSSMYPENHHLSSVLCYSKLKLEFPEEIKTKTKEKEEIQINYKRNNKFNILVCYILLIPK